MANVEEPDEPIPGWRRRSGVYLGKFSAPGRVNLIGEHTDYNGGFVLPTPIPQCCAIDLVRHSDDEVRTASTGFGNIIARYTLGSEKPVGDWIDYVQGLTHVLRAGGYTLRGFDAWIDSDVPLGSGLSSSAALGVALLRALRVAFDLKLDDLEIAILVRRSENEFVGARVGIMDPMVASLGTEGSALFIDAHTLAYESVPLPPGMDLVVINSGLSHQHAAGDYNTRRAECEQARALLGVEQLRDLSLDDLPRLAGLPEPLGRRARHVITENHRVLAAREAMRAEDLAELGRLFYESHASQRDDYQVSIAEIDLLVDLARGERDVYGARLTGGGFGGSVVIITCAGSGRAVAGRIARAYAERTGRQAAVLVPAP